MVPFVVEFARFNIKGDFKSSTFTTNAIQKGHFVVKQSETYFPGKLIKCFNYKFLFFPGITRPGHTRFQIQDFYQLPFNRKTHCL